MKKGAAYIRVSDDRQDEYSPESQIKKIKAYANDRGYEIDDALIFFDNGISAKNTEKRKQFNKMIALAKEKSPPFECIFVWKFSRFARNQEQSIVYKSLLKKRGIDLISVSEPMIEGPFGSLIERIIEWMDEYYLINLSGEVRRGMIEKASRGEAMTPPVLGYSLEGKRYVPNEHSDTVRNIFSSYLSGESKSSIAERMKKLGVVTAKGTAPNARWVDYTLKNPVYIGKIRWSYGGRCASERKTDNVMLNKGLHAPIISDELWQGVQKRLRMEKKERTLFLSKNNELTPLYGLLRCDNCDSPLSPLSPSSPYLQCIGYSSGSCNVSHCIAIKRAETLVFSALKDALSEKTIQIKNSPSVPISFLLSYKEILKHVIEKIVFVKKERRFEIFIK